MEIGRAERAQALGSPAFTATVAESKTLIDRMLRLVRDLAMGLRPSMLDALGLEPALAWQAREFSRRYNVPVDLAVDGDLEKLPDPQRTCVYRVVQEALTNCAKHSAATEIRVQVVRGRSHLDVFVRDNGVGMISTKDYKGLGLTGIKERVKDINGSTSIQPHPAPAPSFTSHCRSRPRITARRMSLRIVLADDHGIVRRGLKALLDAEKEPRRRRRGGDGIEALKMCEIHRPDVAILDIAMPRLNGIDVAERAIKHHPQLKSSSSACTRTNRMCSGRFRQVRAGTC